MMNILINMDIFIQEVISRHLPLMDSAIAIVSLENVDEDGNITKADMFSKQPFAHISLLKVLITPLRWIKNIAS